MSERDLKADLELTNEVVKRADELKHFEHDDFVAEVNVLGEWHLECAEIARHAIERALKAESLVQELAAENTERLISAQAFSRGLIEALEVVIDIVDENEPCGCYEYEGEHPYYCDRCNAIGKARFVLDRAKEVLGDE